jgi:hypothetical protein
LIGRGSLSLCPCNTRQRCRNAGFTRRELTHSIARCGLRDFELVIWIDDKCARELLGSTRKLRKRPPGLADLEPRRIPSRPGSCHHALV